MERIDLAHAAPVRIGRLTLDPPMRRIARDDGASEVVEPRVMQVLLALARADGAILTRDALTQCCWEGRIVGEDAINRVMSRIRRVAEGIGAGSFRLETVTRIGYRLISGDGATAPAPFPGASPRADRRLLIGGGVAAVALAALGIGYAARERDDRSTPTYPDEAAALIDQGSIAMRSGGTEATNQAIGFFREVTARWPELADGWGLLAIAYAVSATSGADDQVASRIARSRAASEQAMRLDPGNAYALAAEAWRRPMRGHWLEIERHVRAAIVRRPDSAILLATLGGVLSSVGRVGEHADILVALAARDQPTPTGMYYRAITLWGANRLEEADRAMDEAFALFPMHYGVWFVRFHLLMYTGRVAEAIAMGENIDGRPDGIQETSFTSILAVARALASRDPGAIDAVIVEQRALAASGSGYAQNAMQFAAALGRLDDAFAIIDAYYFGRGFNVPDVRFPGQQRTYTRLDARHTYHLFHPPLAAARADPRFARLVDELGLVRYWRESGVEPDYARRF